jgi:hypothetical protein
MHSLREIRSWHSFRSTQVNPAVSQLVVHDALIKHYIFLLLYNIKFTLRQCCSKEQLSFQWSQVISEKTKWVWARKKRVTFCADCHSAPTLKNVYYVEFKWMLSTASQASALNATTDNILCCLNSTVTLKKISESKLLHQNRFTYNT